MIEILDNSVQLAVAVGCTLWSGIVAVRHKSQAYFILACFYGTFALGLLYWLLYLLINSYTPKLFYVPELSWIASYLFLLMLCQTLPDKEERSYRPALAWAAPVVTGGVVLYLVQFGEFFANVTWCALMGFSGWLAIRGLLWAQKQTGEAKNRRGFYAALLLLIGLEYALWMISCVWLGDTLANPYYWMDFLISGTLLVLPFAMKKAVRP